MTQAGETPAICDFCSRPAPAGASWLYPCRDLRCLAFDTRGQAVDLGAYAGGWVACRDCAPFVDTGKPETLVGWLLGTVFVSEKHKPHVRAALTAMFTGFFHSRTAAKVRA